MVEGGFIPGNGGMSNQSVSHQAGGWFGQAEEDERPPSRESHPALTVTGDRKRADHRLANSQNPLGPLIQWPRMIADARASFIVVLLNLSGVMSRWGRKNKGNTVFMPGENSIGNLSFRGIHRCLFDYSTRSNAWHSLDFL